MNVVWMLSAKYSLGSRAFFPRAAGAARR